MSFGEYRDHFPRLWLTLPGVAGPVDVQFIVDTGFEGELAIPASTVRTLDARFAGREAFVLGDTSRVERPVYRLEIEWTGEPREVQALVLEGNPLLGNLLMEGMQLQIDLIEGGEVVLESL
jgi:clan AA aspartic protease